MAMLRHTLGRKFRWAHQAGKEVPMLLHLCCCYTEGEPMREEQKQNWKRGHPAGCTRAEENCKRKRGETPDGRWREVGHSRGKEGERANEKKQFWASQGLRDESGLPRPTRLALQAPG